MGNLYSSFEKKGFDLFLKMWVKNGVKKHIHSGGKGLQIWGSRWIANILILFSPDEVVEYTGD